MRDNAFLEYLRMSNRSQFKQIQGPASRSYGSMEWMKWQDIIFDEEGVSCTVVLIGGKISIRTTDYTEFLMAKRALTGKTSHPIIRDTANL